jgi:hypothetical protein
MTSFVLETTKSKDLMETPLQKLNRHISYANFLNQPLTLGMFVPCDDDGNVLDEPLNYKDWLKKSVGVPYILDLSQYEEYQKAQSKVIFSPVTFKQVKSQDDTKFYIVGNTQVFNLSKDNKNLYWHHYSVECLPSDFDESIDLAVSF